MAKHQRQANSVAHRLGREANDGKVAWRSAREHRQADLGAKLNSACNVQSCKVFLGNCTSRKKSSKAPVSTAQSPEHPPHARAQTDPEIFVVKRGVA